MNFRFGAESVFGELREEELRVRMRAVIVRVRDLTFCSLMDFDSFFNKKSLLGRMGTSVANSYSYFHKKIAGKSSLAIIIWYSYLKNRPSISLICCISNTPGIDCQIKVLNGGVQPNPVFSVFHRFQYQNNPRFSLKLNSLLVK
jgi:hypothetical protein